MSPKNKRSFKKKGLKRINKTSKNIQKNIPYSKLLTLSVFINLLVLLFLFVFTEKIPPEVPLFYGFPEGEAQLAPKTSLLLPPLFSIFVIFLNTLIAYYIENDFIKKILIITGFTITFLSMVTTLKIITLVGSF